MTNPTPEPEAGRPRGASPLAASRSPLGRLVAVLLVSAAISGSVYFFSRVEPVETERPAPRNAAAAPDTTPSASPSPAATDSILDPDALPGFETEHLTNAQRLWLYHQAHLEQCSCGCGFNIAECRVEDPTCPVSPGRARELVEEAARRPRGTVPGEAARDDAVDSPALALVSWSQ